MAGFELISSLIAIGIALTVVLVALGASITLKYTKRFTEGKWKELGNFTYLAMFAFLGKLIADFSINLMNAIFINPPSEVINFLWFAGIISIILTGIFMIRISGIIKTLSEQYGFN